MTLMASVAIFGSLRERESESERDREREREIERERESGRETEESLARQRLSESHPQ